MRLINSKVELIEQQPGLEGVYKQIELAGRTCYKSEDKITPDSAKAFVDRMIKSGHGAMLEHGTVYLSAPTKYSAAIDFLGEGTNVLDKYKDNKFSHLNVTLEYGVEWYHVTTNYRVLVENDWLSDVQYITEPTKFHERRITARFTLDRGVSHEFVRHRVFSFAQESTRYCNYSKDKFSGELTYIIPTWLDMPEGNYTYWDGDWVDINKLKIQLSDDNNIINVFLDSLETNEIVYKVLINKGWKPQQARQVLPNALKTELVMTGFASDWDHFFDLRCATSAHPDARKLALELKELIYGKQEE